MSDAARAKAWENWRQAHAHVAEFEMSSFEAGWNAAAEQTAALQEELESYKDPQVVTIPAQDLDALREENARLRGALEQSDRLAAHQTARLSLEITNKRQLAEAVQDYIVIPADLPHEEQLARLRVLSMRADAALLADPEGQP